MKKAIVVVVIILVIAGIIIFSNGHYDFNQKTDVLSFLKAYGSWIMNIGKNLGDITAYAIKKPWLPQ